jgi:hypothetical protein
MNENLDNSKKDIKPVRPEPASNRGQRKTRGGGVLFSSTLTVINSIGLIVLFLWFFNTSGNQQQAGQNFVERISLLEETSEITQDQLDEFRGELDDDLKFVNKEIRKLWDLSNKRNRKNISANLNSIEKLNESLEDISKKDEAFAAKQRAMSVELAKVIKLQEKANENYASLSYQSGSGIGSDQIKEIEESLESFNAYRVQVNQSLIELRQKINDLALRIEDTNNE